MLVGDGLWPYPFDVYILRFREGQEIPPHVDKVDRGEHYRLNIVLKAAASSFVDHQYLKIGASIRSVIMRFSLPPIKSNSESDDITFFSASYLKGRLFIK